MGLAGLDDVLPAICNGVLGTCSAELLPVGLGLRVSLAESLSSKAHEGELALVDHHVVVKIGDDGLEGRDVHAGFGIGHVLHCIHVLAVSVVLGSLPWAGLPGVLLGLLVSDGGDHGDSLEEVHLFLASFVN